MRGKKGGEGMDLSLLTFGLGAVSLGISCFALGASWGRFRERELLAAWIDYCREQREHCNKSKCPHYR